MPHAASTTARSRSCWLEGQQPNLQSTLPRLAAHYEMRPSPCAAVIPNDKPRVERSFWELERSFFNGRSFPRLRRPRHQLAHWLDEVCDFAALRLHSAPALRHRAAQPFALPLTVRHARGRVPRRQPRGYVPYEGNDTPCRTTRHRPLAGPHHRAPAVRVRRRLRCIARHELAPRSSHLSSTQRLHPPLGRKGVPDLAQLAATFEQMASRAPRLQALSVAQPRFCGFQCSADLLLASAKRHRRSRRRSRPRVRFGALEHKPVARILAARAAPVPRRYVADETLAPRSRAAIQAPSPRLARVRPLARPRRPLRTAPRRHPRRHHAQAKPRARRLLDRLDGTSSSSG